MPPTSPSRPGDRQGPTLLLALDVGGTHSRAQVARLEGGQVAPHPAWPEPVVRSACSKEELERFIREMVGRMGPGEDPGAAAVGVAGAALDPGGQGRIRLSNWSGNPTLEVAELAAWGLPAGHTRLVNDMDVAGRGLLEMASREPLPASPCPALFLPEGWQAPGGESSRVLVIPGTGLGTLGLITIRDRAGGLHHRQLSSEAQHALAGPINAEHLELIRRYASEEGGCWPSWEEFASGRGLVRSYRELGRLRGSPAAPAGDLAPDPAAEIARRAVAGSDRLAEAALELYYRAVARVAQILALVYQPRGGIFLAGRTSRQNRAFILRSPFVRELQDNPLQGPLLTRFPVFLVLEELNLRGALQAAREMLAT